MTKTSPKYRKSCFCREGNKGKKDYKQVRYIKDKEVNLTGKQVEFTYTKWTIEEENTELIARTRDIRQIEEIIDNYIQRRNYRVN